MHLQNEDTQYKQDLFSLCNKLSKPKPFDEVAEKFADHDVYFQVVFEKEWQRVIREMANA